MQIQLNTDHHVNADARLAAWAEGELRQRVARHQDQLTRIEVHLSDVNADRRDGHDKRCVLEARPAGRRPVAVSHEAANVAEALTGAADKLLRRLDHDQGRRHDAHARDSIRGAAAPAADGPG